VTLHLLTHAWVARAVRLPAVFVVQRARLRDVLAVHPPRPLRQTATGAPRRRCRACGPSWYSSLAPESVFTSIMVYRGGWGGAPRRRLRWHADACGGGDVWGNARTRPGEHGLGYT
jgi:hypothetical protein